MFTYLHITLKVDLVQSTHGKCFMLLITDIPAATSVSMAGATMLAYSSKQTQPCRQQQNLEQEVCMTNG